MARRVERGQRAIARTLPSDHRPPVSQPPRPGTPFTVPQTNIHTQPQVDKLLQGSQPPRPGTPFSVPQCGKHLISRDFRDFAPPGLIRPTRHKFRRTKPYEEQRFKKPDAKVTEKLQELKALIKASANKSTLDPLRDLKENKILTVPLPLRVPEGMSNPLPRDNRPSVLQPATRKRVASSSVPIRGKVKKSRAVSTGFEEAMDFDQLGRRLPATSTKQSTEDASSKCKEDHTVAGPSSDDSSAVPGPSSADSSALPGTSSAECSAVPGISSDDSYAVPGTSSADLPAVPGTSSADSSAVHGTSSSDSSVVPGPSSTYSSAVPKTCPAHSSAVPGTTSSDASAMPGPSSTDSSALPGTSSAESSVVPGKTSAESSAVPGISSDDSYAVPGTSSADLPAVHGTSADSSAVHGTSSSDSSAVPGPSPAYSSAVTKISSADCSALPGTTSSDSLVVSGPSSAYSFAVPGSSSVESSAGQCEQVISPHIQGSLHHFLSSQGVLGSSTSPQDAQGWSESYQGVLELTKCFQGYMGHSTSAQASQRLPTCAERKVIHVSSSRRRFKRLSPTLQVCKLSTSSPKHVGQDPSGLWDQQQAPSEKDSSKPSSPECKFSGFSFFTNGASPTTSSQEIFTCLTAAKAGQSDESSHKDRQKCSPSSPKCPKQSASSKASLRTDPADQVVFRTSPLSQEDFQSPSPLKNGLRSSFTVQRRLNAIAVPQVSLTTLTPAQVETKLPTSTPGAEGPLSFSEGVLESYTQTQDVVGTPESTQRTLVPSTITQSHLAPSPSSLGVLRPSQSVRGALGLSPSTEDGQRRVLKSALPHKRRITYSTSMKRDPENSHSSKRTLKDAPSKQPGFKMSISDRELFIYPLPSKRALLTCHQDQKSQGCTNTLPVGQASSILIQSAEKIQPFLPPYGNLDHSVSIGVAPKFSTNTSDMLGFSKPVQISPSTNLTQEGTVGQNMSTKGVLATAPSLEMACGCGTSTKHVLGHIPTVQNALDPIPCVQGAMGGDLHTQESVASCISKRENSLDSTYAQESMGSLQTSQEAMGTSLSPQEDQPTSPTTQGAINTSSSAQRAVSPSPWPQVSPEHIPNTLKSLDYTLSSKGALEAVLPIKMAMKPDVSIQKLLPPSSAEESSLRTSTCTQGGGLEASLLAHEAVRPLTYVHGALGETTSTQVALVPSPHAEATVKTCTGTQGTLRPSPSQPEALECTISELGALQLSVPTQECSFDMTSLGRFSRHSLSNKVVPRHPVSGKHRIRVDPSDKGGFRSFPSDEASFDLPPSAKQGLASSPVSKETSKATTTPQVSPTQSMSLPNILECSTHDQGTMVSCQSTQEHAGQSISSQNTQGPSLSTSKALVCPPSTPGLQRISSSLPRAPEHVSHAQSDLSLCKIDFKTTQSFLNFQGSKGKSTYKKNCLECVPLAQTSLKTSTSCKASKNPSAQETLEPLVSEQGEGTEHQSENDNLRQSISAQGTGGSSPCNTGALVSTRHAHRKKKILPSNQWTEKHSLSPRGARRLPKSETRTLENLPSKQGSSSRPKKTLLSSKGSVKPSSSAQCAQKAPQMTAGTLTTVGCKQWPLEHAMAVQETLGSLPSTPEFPEHSTSIRKKLGHSSHMVESQDTSPSFQGTTGPLPSPSEPTGHSLYHHRSQESSLDVSSDLAHFLSNKLCISSQPTLCQSRCTQHSLQQSSSSQKILGTSESAQRTHRHLSSGSGSLGRSPCVPRTTGTLPHAPKPLGHSSPIQASPTPPSSLPKTVSCSLYSQATLDSHALPQISPLPSAFTQVPGETSVCEETTLGKPIAAQRIKEPLCPSSGTLSYLESDKQELGIFPSAQVPLEIPLSAEGTLESLSSTQGVLGTSPSAQESLKTSTSKQDHIETVSSVPKSLKQPTSSQRALTFSPPAQHTIQCSSCSPQTTGPAPGVLGDLLSSPKPNELSSAAEETLPVGQDKETQSTLGHSPLVREDVASSQPVSATLETLPPSPPETGRHSSSTQGSAETFASSQGCLEPLQSSQGLLKLSISAQALINTSQYSEGSYNPLGLSSAEQGTQASSGSARGAVEPCLSTQGTVYQSISTQRSAQHSTSPQRLSSPLHTQGTGIQSTSTHCKVADSPSNPVYQGYTHPSQKTAGTLKSEQGSLTISATAHGFVEPLPSPQGPLGYSSSAPSVQKSSTSTTAHVVSGGSPLELSISAQLIPLFSSLSLSDTSLSVEGTFDLSNPTEGTLGTSTSCQGPNESLNSAQRAQQTDPPASESSGSMHSSKSPMVISLSGQGTLGSVSSSLGPLTMSLSVQVNPGPVLSVQEPGGLCLSLQENLEGYTCTHGKPGISDASPDFEFSASTTVSLGSSPSVQLNLTKSQPDLLSLNSSMSAQGVLGTLTSTQGSPETSLLSQEPPGTCLKKETLGYSPSNLEDLSPSESALDTVETLPCVQNTAETAPVALEIIETLSPAKNSLRFQTSSSLSPESEELMPSTQCTFMSSDSVPGTLESLPSVSGALGTLESNEGSLGLLLSEQRILGTPATPQETLELSQPAQGLLEPTPSTQDTVGTSFSTEFLGLSLCAHDDFVPTSSHKRCQRHSPFLKKGPRLFNSTQRTLKSVPFSEEDIRSSLSERDVLKRISSAESSLTSFKYSKKDSSPTSSSPPKEGFSHSPSQGGCFRHSNLGETRSRHVSLDQTGLNSVPSEDEGWELCHSFKTGLRVCNSNKSVAKLETETTQILTISDSTKGACGSSPFPEEGLQNPPPPQGIHRQSKSTKTTSKEAPSDQRDTRDSNSEHESHKPSSLSERELRHSSSSKKDRKPKPSPQEGIASSISTEECTQTTPSHEESLRHSTSHHEISRHTTFTRRRERNASEMHKALKSSPADQEGIGDTLDGDSPHECVKPSSSPQQDTSHPVSTKEGSQHVPIVQEEEKPSISSKREHTAYIHTLWGFIHPPGQKGSTTSFPVRQRNYSHIICQPEDLVPSLSYQGRDPALQYESGYPLYNPSDLGGHRYIHFVRSNLKRIPLQNRRYSSYIFSSKGAISPSQSDQCRFRLSSSHQRDIGYVPPVSGSLRMFQAERDRLSNAPSMTLGLREAFYDKREFRNVSSNQQWVRPSSSALGSLRLTHSSQTGTRASQYAKWNL